MLLASGAMIGVLGTLAGLGPGRGSLLYVLGLVPLALLPFLLRPAILVPLANRALALVHRNGIGRDSVLTMEQATGLFLGYCVVQAVSGLSFFLVVLSLHDGVVNPLLAVGV